MSIASDIRRLLTVFGGGALILSVWMLTQTSGSTSVRGPIKSDDLPWGDLVTLNQAGAIVFTIAAGLTLAAGLAGLRVLLLASAGAWTILTVVVGVVVATQGSFLGASRPGTVAIALAMALVTVVPMLLPELTESAEQQAVVGG